MSEIAGPANLEQLREALTTQGQTLSTEQLQALAELVASLGGVDMARAAVELLVDLQDAA